MAAEVQDVAHSGAEHAASPPELPNFIHWLHLEFAGNPVVDFLANYINQFFSFLVIIVLAVFFSKAMRNRSMIPGRLQAFAEMVVEAVLNIVKDILGEKEGRRYFPFLGTLFIFIIAQNWFGLVPLMRAPTSHFSVTASMAICVFFFCQINALRRLGLRGHIYHLMGEPKDATGWILVPLFLPLHIMEEFIKPLSLSCRLFGNIFGEDLLLGISMLIGLILTTMVLGVAIPADYVLIGVPLHVPFMFMSLLFGGIQALVFTLLAAVYISQTIPHDEHHEEQHSH